MVKITINKKNIIYWNIWLLLNVPLASFANLAPIAVTMKHMHCVQNTTTCGRHICWQTFFLYAAKLYSHGIVCLFNSVTSIADHCALVIFHRACHGSTGFVLKCSLCRSQWVKGVYFGRTDRERWRWYKCSRTLSSTDLIRGRGWLFYWGALPSSLRPGVVPKLYHSILTSGQIGKVEN